MSVCVSCKDPLVLGTDEDEMEDGNNAPVPDDLLLPCGCHFHWQCFLDSASDVAITLKCPSCGSYLPTNQAGGPSVTNPVFPASQEVAIVTRYESEGGVQENYNILPDVTEEAYLLMHPEFRPAHAFHSMCAEGNAEELLAIIADVGSSPDDGNEAGAGASLTVNQLLRYQDPLDGMKSPLHIAIEKNQAQIALLLLYMASGLPDDSFPADALEVAKGLGLHRPMLAGIEDDIRTLKDAYGHTAEEYAYKAGGSWIQFIEAGMFA